MTTKQLDFVSIPESQHDQDDDLGKFSFGKFDKALGVINGGINAINGVHGIGQKFGLWDADSEGAEVSDGNTVNGFAQQSTSAFDSLTGSELALESSSEYSAPDSDNDDLGIGPIAVFKGGAKLYSLGQTLGFWDVDSEGSELKADPSGFDSFLLQSGSDLIAPITEPFADATAITDLVTGKSGIQESGMDGLVAAGPLDAVQVDQPRNNDF